MLYTGAARYGSDSGAGAVGFVVQKLQPLVGRRVSTGKVRQLGQQGVCQSPPLCGRERRQGLVVQALLPTERRSQEALQVCGRQRAERRLPGLAVCGELRTAVRQQPGLFLEFRHRARAERAKRLPNAIEQADFRLPGAPVAPGEPEERIDQGVEFLPARACRPLESLSR